MAVNPGGQSLPEHIRAVLRIVNSELVPQMSRFFLFEFELLTNHVDSTERHLREQQAQFDEEFAANSAALDPEAQAEYADFMIDETEFYRALPRLQWYSQFGLAYSAFEFSLLKVGEIANRRLRPGETQSRRRSPGVADVVADLGRLGIHAPFRGLLWDDTVLLKHLRNKIIHEQGTFAVESSQLAALRSRAFPGFDCSPAEDGRVQVEISAEFVRAALDIFQRILNDLVKFRVPELAVD